MDMDKCVILKGMVLNENVTIIGGLEDGKIKLQVIPPKFEYAFLKKFEMAYNSPEHLNYLHGYSPSGNVHKQPTLDCVEHILCEHMENSTEKAISLQLPEILEQTNDDENTVY